MQKRDRWAAEPLGTPPRQVPRDGAGSPALTLKVDSGGFLLTLQAESGFRKISFQDSMEFPIELYCFVGQFMLCVIFQKSLCPEVINNVS